MHCPRCRTRLSKVKTKDGVFFHCPKCNGRAAGLALLRRVGSMNAIKRLWVLVCQSAKKPGVRCPICDRQMAEVPLAVGSNVPPMQLDVCPTCQFVWFDPHEFGQFPAAPKKVRHEMPIKAREAIAMVDLQRAAKQEDNMIYESSDPEESWHWLPALLGMPVEENTIKLRSWPWLTWGLAAALVAVFALTFQHLQTTAEDFGLVPAKLWRYGGFTLATSFFLHGGIFHLVSNVYFLLIFGDNVEDDLGRWRYVLLLVVAALIGDWLHVIVNSASTTPCIGASGGISGIIAYYVLRFPRARLGILIRYWYYWRWVHFPASVGLLIWVVLQFLLAFEQKIGIGGVAAFAHLGGAAAGVAAWCIGRMCSREATQPV